VVEGVGWGIGEDWLGMADAAEMLNIMVNGKRLKDISDLPLDLAI
jgi:hypothetical protein